jgi:hypothetical protein
VRLLGAENDGTAARVQGRVVHGQLPGSVVAVKVSSALQVKQTRFGHCADRYLKQCV